MAGMLVALAALAARAEVELPLGDPRDNIVITAQRGHHWRQGAYDVWLLDGACRIRQGDTEAQSDQAVLWVDQSPPESGVPTKIIAYLEGKVLIDFGHRGAAHRATGKSARTLEDDTWLGRFFTLGQIDYRLPVIEGEPSVKPAVFQRGVESRDPTRSGTVAPAQFQQPGASGGSSFSGRRVRIGPRSGNDLQAETVTDPNRNETILVATMGVSIVIEGATAPIAGGVQNLGDIEIQADNVVAWTSNIAGLNLFGEAPGQPRPEARDVPIEFYLEGHIVFRQGRRVVYADRMYYNVNRQYGVVLDAEMLTPVTDYEGLLRLKADVLHQLDRENFSAFGAAITSSRIGYPRYWLQSEEITLRDVQQTRLNPLTGQPEIDPISGEPDVDHKLLATSRNNFVYISGVPVAYWPVFITDARTPTYYLESLRLRNDKIFGTQIFTEFNAYQVLGLVDPPEGTDWRFSLDYLSKRGPAAGTTYEYNRPDFLGYNTPISGMLDAWGIKDTGLDNLGLDRRELPPEEEWRGRVLGRHRQWFSEDLRLTAELGLISDRNFLEQYFEQEWDQDKDQTTGFELKQRLGHQTLSLTSDIRVNDFFTQTEWLPRVDHFLLGHSIGDMLTWHAHSHVGYARLEVAEPPKNPEELAKFDPLAWEAPREGIRAATRQELDLPLDVGPVKVVPYVLGEAAHWGEDLSGEELTRVYGQAGIRASLPFWRVDPAVQSQLLNLNGLAHKITFETDAFYADASQDLSELPLYDPLDDDSIEFFRRRFYFDTFGGVPGGDVPLQFDERYFAVRSGLQGFVSSPSTEIAEDQAQVRMAIRQRWQTKRGLPGRERVVDWIVFDVGGTLFPDADNDNFGEEVGQLNYDFRWHIGDRVTLLSDGYADVFDNGLRTFSVGTVIGRPNLGRLHIGYRNIESPFSSDILSGSLSYRMSEKWIVTAGASVDFGDTGNVTEGLALTRIGESALIRVGMSHDVSRDNLGMHLMIEPRFLPTSRLGNVGGIHIPPAGALGLD